MPAHEDKLSSHRNSAASVTSFFPAISEIWTKGSRRAWGDAKEKGSREAYRYCRVIDGGTPDVARPD